MQSTICQGNVSDATAAAVRAMIVDGRIVDGERVNEVQLAASLGVSRTPVREALNRLTAEGAVDSRPRLGYFVRPLSAEEFDQVYGIRPLLEPAALALAGIPAAARIEKLEQLNRRLAVARSPAKAITLDDAWHIELLADCPNRVLIELIENIVLRTRRYELALMRETQQVLAATDDHARILAALRDGDIHAAIAALKDNLRRGREPIVAWLNQRATARGEKSK